MNLFRFVPGYESVVFDEGKEPLFLLLVAFVIAFAGARGYARVARRRGWSSASVHGTHLHHEVVGILLVLVSGLVGFSRLGTDVDVLDWCAIAFGVGAAFVLDEFALVFYLRDVYWSEEGRASVDAAILGVLVVGAMLVVSEPFGLHDPLDRHLGRSIAAFAIASNAAFTAVAFLKGKVFAGMTAIAVPPIGWVAGIRLAKPTSPWAHRFYDDHKLEEAERRTASGLPARFQRRVVNLVGGS
jgi:hypothetical protein